MTATYPAFRESQRRDSAVSMPIAAVVSALRRSASTANDRARVIRFASRAGARDACSVKSVAPASTTAPISASSPSQGWIRAHSSKKTGIHGRSTIAIGPCPVREGPDLIELPYRLRHLTERPRGSRKTDHRPVRGTREVLVEEAGRARHEAAPNDIQQALEREGRTEQQ